MNKSQSLGKWNRVYPRIPHTTPRRDSVHRKRRKEMNSQNKEWQLYGLCTVVVVVVLGVSSHTLHYRLVKQATKSLAKINSELTTSATKLPAVSVFPFLLPNNKEFNKKKKNTRKILRDCHIYSPGERTQKTRPLTGVMKGFPMSTG